MIPKHADFVVVLLWSVNGTLNRVAVIVDHKDNRLISEADIGADFLNSHLEGAFADNEDDTAREFKFFLGNQRAKSCSYSESNGGPEYLGYVADIIGKCGVRHLGDC